MDVGPRGNRVVPYLLVTLMAVGMSLVAYSTVWGAGLISDSFQYTASARNFARGDGFSLPYGDGELEPMSKYPPLFSVVLAGFELLGGSAIQGARIVNIVLFGVNILLVFLSIQKLTDSSLFSLFGSALFALSFVLVEVHSWALSEPLYICLGLVSFLVLHKYLEELRTKWLALSALVVSLAFLTRYAGLSLAVSIAFVLLLSRVEIVQKLRDLFLFLLIAILPAGVWTLRGYFLTHTINDRTIGLYPLTIRNIVNAIDVVYGWLIPVSLVQGREKILLLLTAIIIPLVFFLLARSGTIRPAPPIVLTDPKEKIILLHAIYFIAYGLVVVASKTWVDPDIGLSDRILSPMLVTLLILLAVFFSYLWNHFDRVQPVLVLLSFGLTMYYAAGTFATVRAFNESGIGIARRGWHRSEVLQSLSSYSSYSMYTNSNSSLYLWSDRSGYGIPEFEQIKETGTEEEVLLVIFHHVPPAGKRLNELTSGLELLGEDQVVSIYALSPE
jgi:hypothetical protein